MAEKEYIEREAFIEILKKTKKDCEHYADKVCCDFAIRMVNLMPTADVQEVRHGSWKPGYEDWRKQIVGDECSECGFKHYGTNIRNYHYGPNCGVKMDKE